LLIGCTAPLYSPPADLSAPTLSIESDGGLPMVFENGGNCTEPINLSADQWRGGLKSLPVRPGSEIAIRDVWTSGVVGVVQTCEAIVSFTPLTDVDYLARSVVGPKTCGILVFRKRRGDPEFVVEETARKRQPSRLMMMPSSPMCSSE
jgi:hypothetical protein